MVSKAKRDANRRNAQKSTGPKTEDGKARSSRNASTHGIFCRDICLDGENENAFIELREEFIRALVPQDIMEMTLVDEIVMANWRLRRVRRAEKILHLTKADELRDAQQEDADEVEQLLHDPYRKSEEPQGERKRQLGLTNQKLDGAVTLLALCADPADPNFERL